MNYPALTLVDLPQAASCCRENIAGLVGQPLNTQELKYDCMILPINANGTAPTHLVKSNQAAIPSTHQDPEQEAGQEGSHSKPECLSPDAWLGGATAAQTARLRAEREDADTPSLDLVINCLRHGSMNKP